MNAIDAPEDLDPTEFDAVIIAASLHTGHYQAAVEHFVRQHHHQLNAMLSVFVSVSLAAAGQDEDDVQGLARCVEELQRSTSWTPRRIHHAAGAFRYTQYDFFKRWAMKYIAWRKGGPTDTSQDYELPTGPLSAASRMRWWRLAPIQDLASDGQAVPLARGAPMLAHLSKPALPRRAWPS